VLRETKMTFSGIGPPASSSVDEYNDTKQGHGGLSKILGPPTKGFRAGRPSGFFTALCTDHVTYLQHGLILGLDSATAVPTMHGPKEWRVHGKALSFVWGRRCRTPPDCPNDFSRSCLRRIWRLMFAMAIFFDFCPID